LREPRPEGFLEALSNLSPTSQVRIPERLFPRLHEAYARLIEQGNLAALKTGAGWRIHRADLEKL
jgi:hypothetical protein